MCNSSFLPRRSVIVSRREATHLSSGESSESSLGSLEEGEGEGTEGIAAKERLPMYHLTPVNRYGDSIEGVPYLSDEGTMSCNIPHNCPIRMRIVVT